MSDLLASDKALSFVERWRERDPALRLAEVYARDPGWIIAMGLYFELSECLFRLQEPSVREAKLGWWAEEVGCYGQGQARHPLSAALHERGVATQTLRSIVFGAAALLDAPAAESHENLNQQREALLLALAELLLELELKQVAEPVRSDWLAALRLLDDCFRVYSLGQQKTEPLPALSLAEHAEVGLSRTQIAALEANDLASLRRRLTNTWRVDSLPSSPALAAYLALWVPALRRTGAEPKVGAWSAIRAWHAARRGQKSIDR